MTRLQALTICRDAVQMTKGVHANLWYDGPNQHCTIGALTQVAVDIGFPVEVGMHMMGRFRKEMGPQLEQRIVDVTDGMQGITPQERRKRILDILNYEIAKESENAPAVPNSPAEIINAVQQPAVADAVALPVVRR